MPLVRDKLGNAPTEPHLALVEYDGVRALPVGTQLIIVADPTRADRTIPVFLAKVTRETLVFRCNCGKPGCTRVLHYKLKAAGKHPSD